MYLEYAAALFGIDVKTLKMRAWTAVFSSYGPRGGRGDFNTLVAGSVDDLREMSRRYRRWSEAEDKVVLAGVLASPRLSSADIAAKLPGRTQDAVTGRFKYHLRKPAGIPARRHGGHKGGIDKTPLNARPTADMSARGETSRFKGVSWYVKGKKWLVALYVGPVGARKR